MRSNAFGGVFVGCWAFVQIRGVSAVRSSKNRPRAHLKPCYKGVHRLFFVAAAKVRGWGAEAKPLESYARGRGGAPRLGASIKGYELESGERKPPHPRRVLTFPKALSLPVFIGFLPYLVAFGGVRRSVGRSVVWMHRGGALGVCMWKD